MTIPIWIVLEINREPYNTTLVGAYHQYMVASQVNHALNQRAARDRNQRYEILKTYIYDWQEPDDE